MNTHKKTKKEQLVDAATKLFYEKGLKETFFEDIAEICGVSAPLITYHFKNKDGLARRVVETYIKNINDVVAEKMYRLKGSQYDQHICTAISIIMSIQIYKEDQTAFRFYSEYLNSGIENLYRDSFVNSFKLLDRQTHLRIDRQKDELSMLAAASYFSTLSLIYGYFTGRFNCTYNEMVDYTIKNIFRNMNFEDEAITDILSHSKEMLQLLNFKVYPYFRIE